MEDYMQIGKATPKTFSLSEGDLKMLDFVKKFLGCDSRSSTLKRLISREYHKLVKEL